MIAIYKKFKLHFLIRIRFRFPLCIFDILTLPIHMETLLKYKKLFIILIGFLVYSLSLTNGFTWDDIPFIIKNSQAHGFNLLSLFGQSVFNSVSFYRPIPAVYFSAAYAFLGQNAFFYHLLQLSLHMISAYLLFIAFCLFFTEEVAIVLSIIFLIHPINVESVAFISSTTSELFFLFGISAFLLSVDKKMKTGRLLLISLLLFLSVLTKETGFLFFPLILVFRYLYKKSRLKDFLISGTVIGILYLFFRSAIGGVTYVAQNFAPIGTLSLNERLLNIPAIIMYYLKTFVFPVHLVISQTWIVNPISAQNFLVPLIICIVLVSVLIVFAINLYNINVRDLQNRNPKEQDIYFSDRSRAKFTTLAFFTIWFLLGMIMIIQIIPLEMTVADRWFYFPIVGLLGIIGVGLQLLQALSERYIKIYYICLIILMLIFSVRSFVRTLDWKDNLTLYTHDVNEDPNNPILLDGLASNLFLSGKINEAYTYESRAVNLFPTMVNISHLGEIYQKNGQNDKAAIEYERAISLYKPSAASNNLKSNLQTIVDYQLEHDYNNLAAAYIYANKPKEAISILNEKAIRKFPSNANFYMILAIAQSEIGNHQKALEAITKAYQISQDPNITSLYNKIINNQPLNFR
jgi:protein O-mannosyl-transferase